MADPASPGRPKWTLLLVVLLLLVVFVVWQLRSSRQIASAPETEPTVPSSEFIVAPTGPAVPVTLPTTPMTNVPPSPEPTR